MIWLFGKYLSAYAREVILTKIAAGSAASVCTVARVTGTISRDEEKTCERILHI